MAGEGGDYLPWQSPLSVWNDFLESQKSEREMQTREWARRGSVESEDSLSSCASPTTSRSFGMDEGSGSGWEENEGGESAFADLWNDLMLGEEKRKKEARDETGFGGVLQQKPLSFGVFDGGLASPCRSSSNSTFSSALDSAWGEVKAGSLQSLSLAGPCLSFGEEEKRRGEVQRETQHQHWGGALHLGNEKGQETRVPGRATHNSGNHGHPNCIFKKPGGLEELAPVLQNILSMGMKRSTTGRNRDDAEDFARRYGIQAEEKAKPGLYYRIRKGKYRKEF